MTDSGFAPRPPLPPSFVKAGLLMALGVLLKAAEMVAGGFGMAAMVCFLLFGHAGGALRDGALLLTVAVALWWIGRHVWEKAAP